MLLPLTCLKRDFLKVLQSLRGYIDTILPKSLGHIATLAYRQACPEAVVRGLTYKNYKLTVCIIVLTKDIEKNVKAQEVKPIHKMGQRPEVLPRYEINLASLPDIPVSVWTFETCDRPVQ